MNRVKRYLKLAIAAVGAAVLPSAGAADLDSVKKAEAERVAVVARVRPAVTAIFSSTMEGGGSGVVIDPDGYALTNFHVVGEGKTFKCGLADGNLYDAVLVGLDKVGDVALIKLFAKEKVKGPHGNEIDRPFPHVALGDSDTVHPGDWSLAMGNPFLLATDFTPTVTFGIVSGTHRYQYPAGTLLEYTDCIQVDTSINPGNSGGPLFNMRGELIGINGRGSFDKRGRVNSGVGYAISINQIKNFLGHLYVGIDTDHATLGASVKTIGEDYPRVLIQAVLDEADVARRGVAPEDELVEFAGRPVTSVNQYKNVLGIFPKGWRLPLTYRRDNKKTEVLVRLMGVMPKDMAEGGAPRPPGPRPRPAPRPPANQPPSPAMKFFKAKKGFANYYFNEEAQKTLLSAFARHGDFTSLKGAWALEGELDRKGTKAPFRLEIVEIPADDDKGPRTIVKLNVGGLDYTVEPLKQNPDLRDLKDPPGSGGVLLAFYHYHRLLTLRSKGFEGAFTHGGREPFYPFPIGEATQASLAARRIDADVAHSEHAAVHARWYFSPNDSQLLGVEVVPDKNDDPCELFLSDYKPVEGRALPHRLAVRYGNDDFGVLTVRKYELR
jgi:S1-C subfamily serine protease